jgi:hypothetical protein
VYTLNKVNISQLRHVSRTQVSSWPIRKSVSINSSWSTPAAVPDRVDPSNNNPTRTQSQNERLIQLGSPDTRHLVLHSGQEAVHKFLRPTLVMPFGSPSTQENRTPWGKTLNYSRFLADASRPVRSNLASWPLALSSRRTYQPNVSTMADPPIQRGHEFLQISPPPYETKQSLVRRQFYILILGPLLTSAASSPLHQPSSTAFGFPSTMIHLPKPHVHRLMRRNVLVQTCRPLPLNPLWAICPLLPNLTKHPKVNIPKLRRREKRGALNTNRCERPESHGTAQQWDLYVRLDIRLHCHVTGMAGEIKIQKFWCSVTEYLVDIFNGFISRLLQIQFFTHHKFQLHLNSKLFYTTFSKPITYTLALITIS